MEAGNQGAEQGGPRPSEPTSSPYQGTEALPKTMQFLVEEMSLNREFPESQSNQLKTLKLPS